MSIYPNINKTIPAHLIDKVCDKIVANVTIDENDCWIWTGSMIGAYGRIKIDGKQFFTHRVSSELWHDGYDPSLLVCHECPNGHNKACMNPWHLAQGTQAYNMSHPDTRALISERTKAGLKG